MYVGVLPASMSVHQVPEEGVGSPGTGVAGGAGVPEPGPSRRTTTALLNAEPSLLPLLGGHFQKETICSFN